jgi:hypothetical protein
MAYPRLAAGFTLLLEEALTVLFCQIDDAYAHLDPRGGHYASLKQLSGDEVLTLALFQQLRRIESERSFLREIARFFSDLFPEVVGFRPSSSHRRVRTLRRFLDPLRRAILPELVGNPETLIVLVTGEASARRPSARQRVEIAFSSLKRLFRLGETLAKTLVELTTRIAAKMTAYTYAFLVNRKLGRPQGRIKDLWA